MPSINRCGLEEAQFKKCRAQLLKLLKTPLVKQKTEEWYNMRHNMITASDFAQALGEGKFGSTEDLIMKKCEKCGDSKAFSASNPFFRWGNLFEPVAIELYSLMHGGIKIHEFGLIQHHTHTFFGASPDGISDAGIMVEIKCPLKRKIIPGADVPKQYYYQIQGQLDVCKLDVCDYFECEFTQISIEEVDENTNTWRGALIDAEEPIYGPIIKPGSLGQDVLDSFCKENPGKTIVWSLSVFNQKRVHKDAPWVEAKLKDLEVVWNKILHYRNNADKLEIEVGRKFSIDTERAYPKRKADDALQSYAFREFE